MNKFDLGMEVYWEEYEQYFSGYIILIGAQKLFMDVDDMVEVSDIYYQVAVCDPDSREYDVYKVSEKKLSLCSMLH